MTYCPLQVSIIGQVVSVQKQTTNSVYVLDDGTGSLEARQWVDSDAEESTSGGIEYVCRLSHFLRRLLTFRIRELRYVKVNGTLKSFGKKRYINATQIRHITDPHEIYFHILESIYVTLLVERGPVSISLYNNYTLTQHIKAVRPSWRPLCLFCSKERAFRSCERPVLSSSGIATLHHQVYYGPTTPG